jgi:nicotinate-nucleotide pyrophosphorylase (carboxylating)
MKPSPSVPSRDFAASLEVLSEPIVRAALLEDVGRGGDLTTEAIVEPNREATAQIVARASGVIAGVSVAVLAFRLLERRIGAAIQTGDGERVEAGGVVAEIAGGARAILTAERTALNFLAHLSGIATATRTLVDLVAGTGAKIADTRKTTPGLRVLERYAVACGGGTNHRFGLDDGILIKDNHLALAGSIRAAVADARARAGHMVKVEIEVDTLEQLEEALAEPIDAVLLDNMDPTTLAEAVRRIDGRVLVEASGSVDQSNVLEIARAGVDVISVGRLTHSAPALDLSLEVLSLS